MTILDPLKLVWNMRSGALWPPPGGMKVDRSSKFGNPFIVNVHGDHNRVCDMHIEWLDKGTDFGNLKATEELRRWVLDNVKLLRGMNLLCWCRSPGDPPTRRCHALELARRANQE